jgi:hypothetical protein
MELHNSNMTNIVAGSSHNESNFFDSFNSYIEEAPFEPRFLDLCASSDSQYPSL